MVTASFKRREEEEREAEENKKKKKKTKKKDDDDDDDDDDESTSGSAVIGWRSWRVSGFPAAVWPNSPTVGKNEPLTFKQPVKNL